LAWLDAIWRQVPPWAWVGGTAAAVLLVLLVAAAARGRCQRRALEALQQQVGDVARSIRQSEAAVAAVVGALERRAPGPGDAALAEPEREQLVNWIAAGQELVGVVRAALRDYERARREGDAARREAERLRRELARLQGEHDRLLRERRQLARALATFVHETGSPALLDTAPDHPEIGGHEDRAPRRPPPDSEGDRNPREG
jgi:hypothetical protein